MRKLTAILAAALWGLAPAATAGEASESVMPTGIAAYPQRLADQPLSIGKGIGEGDLEGSYVFSSAFGFEEIPNIRYGITPSLEAVLLGIRYTVAEDGQYLPGLAIRLQLHDFDWEEQPGNINPYPVIRPGVTLDAKDKFPEHLTLEGHISYLVSIVTGDYLHGGGPIATANLESQEIVPLTVDLIYSPLDQLSLKGTFGFVYDLLPIPNTPDQSEIVGRVDAIWTQSNRFDLRLFFTGNWYTGPLGFIPQLGLGVTYRL